MMTGCIIPFVVLIFGFGLCMDIFHLIEMYKSVCGDMLCHTNRSMSIPIIGDNNKEFCPVCSCDDSCIWTRNCCPDKFFSWKFSCVDMDIIKRKGTLAGTIYKTLVTQCPDHSNGETKIKCENITNNIEGKLTNVPVSSTSSGISYRNIHCARCYNEKEENIHSWNIDTECEEFTDFNFLSTYDAIEVQAIKSKCSFSYMREKNLFPLSKCWNDECDGDITCDSNLKVIAECNVTGTWNKYDPYIDMACRTYDNKYSFMFKNVFCYMCNPPKITGSLIDTCNQTGLWEKFNNKLVKKCVMSDKSEITYPFKNFFCYLCNIKRGDNNKAIELITPEIKADIVHSGKEAENNWEFETIIQSTQLYFDQIILNGENVLKDVHDLTGHHYSVRKDFKSVILSDVLAKYYAYTGEARFSPSYSFGNSPSSCDSSNVCFFTGGDCCIDRYFERTVQCSHPHFSSGGHGYPVFDSCSSLDSSIISDLCLLNSPEHFFNFMPVEINVGTNGYLHYKNIFCALCDASNNPPNIDFTRLRIWGLEIICRVFIPHFYFTSIQSYFELLRQNNCTFEYKPSDYSNVQCYDRQRTCNATGYWVEFDPNIEFACENIVHPSQKLNAFCDICNPMGMIEIKYHYCNESGDWTYYNDEINENCEILPAIKALAPYKNYFCRQCNLKTNSYFTQYHGVSDNRYVIGYTPYAHFRQYGQHGPSGVRGPLGVSYRTIFAFSNYRPRLSVTSIQCNVSQTLYQNECLDIVCYPGKMLVESGCKPLLQTTSNLGYILFASMKVTAGAYVNNTEIFHQEIHKEFKDHVLQKMDLPPWIQPFDSTYLISDKNCQDNLEKQEVIFIDVYYELFFDENVNRTLVEETLVQSISTSFNFSYEDNTHLADVIPNAHAINTPNIIAKSEFTDKCHIKMQTDNAYSHRYIHSHVTELLLCEQIELSSNEFDIDKSTLILHVKRSEVKLPSNKYILVAPGNARVCTDYLKPVPQPSSNQDVNVWSILTFLCIIISLICLFITFITYCFFASLRTLPGKNNMCLVFALFCSNVVFLTITQGIDSEIGCKAVGIIMHYFWLATFSCLGICSFHMFRVFCSKTGAQSTGRSKFVVYIVFSYSFPAFVISLNIVTTLLLKHNMIGYGGSTCFLTEPMAFIFSFIVPIGLICSLNVFFFISTSVTIARRPKLKHDSMMKTNQVHFVVYVKLFAITGITWLLQIVDAFVPESAFSNLVALLNALQGLFIFLSYICNKRVLNLYRNSHKRDRETIAFLRTNKSSKTMTTNISGSHISQNDTTI